MLRGVPERLNSPLPIGNQLLTFSIEVSSHLRTFKLLKPSGLRDGGQIPQCDEEIKTYGSCGASAASLTGIGGQGDTSITVLQVGKSFRRKSYFNVT